jgi:uncharacterized repeat protein (TIGR01451 family)
MAQLASAHPVVVDGLNTSVGGKPEWLGVGPRTNTGHIIRNAAGQGEYAWNDQVGDVRFAATDTFTKAVDLIGFRVTADQTNLYVRAVFDAIPQNTPSGSRPQLQVAIDTGAGGSSALVDPAAGAPAGTAVASAAAWEYLYQTQFDQGLTRAPLRFTGATGSPAAAATAATAALVLSNSNTAEIGIPWSELGGAPGAAGRRLRFTVAVFRANGAAPADGASSRVVDAVSPLATLAEVNDGAIDGNGGSPAFFDVNFDVAGEVFAPLLVSEFVPNPFGTNTAQWVEIANASGAPISLAGYKIGDETSRGGIEGMYEMPSITLPAGQTILFTRSKLRFGQLGYTLPQGALLYEFSALKPYSSWATNAEGFNLKDTVGLGGTGSGTDYSDEVVLLDAGDTIVDILQYTSPNPPSPYPDVTPIIVPAAGVPEDLAFQRCPYTRDTNDTALDVVRKTTRAEHTPGVVCVDNQVDLGIVKTGPSVAVQNSQINYVLHYSNAGVGATSVTITDTLPAGVTYITDTATPALPASTGDSTARHWTLPKLVSGGTGVITLTVQLPAGPTTVTNQATIGNAQVDLNLANNSSSVVTAVVLQQSPDVQVSKALVNAKLVYPNGKAIYNISYSNTGDLAAADVSVVDTFPATLANPVASAGCPAATPGASTITLAVGTLAPGAAGQCTITFDVIGGAGAAIDNQVAISTSTPENNAQNNSFTLPGQVLPPPPIDLSIVKTAGAASVPVNGQLRYTITLKNSSLAAQSASAIVVTDPLPAGVTYVSRSVQGGAGEPTLAGNTLIWNLPAGFTLAPGQSQTFSFAVSLFGTQVGDVLDNTATVSGGGAVEPADNLADNSSTSGTTTVGKGIIYLSIIHR